jgi:hypothetical protein
VKGAGQAVKERKGCSTVTSLFTVELFYLLGADRNHSLFLHTFQPPDELTFSLPFIKNLNLKPLFNFSLKSMRK